MALANLAFAAFNNFFKAALAFGVFANVNFFLNAATFMRYLSWRFKAFFVSGSLALASLFWILAALLANFFAYAFTTIYVAFLSAARAFAILALIAAFLAGGADLSYFLRAATFFAALNWAFNAAFLSGSLALESYYLIAAIFSLRTFDFFNSTLPDTFLTFAVILTSLALAALSYALIAAFFAFGASASFFLRAATFFWALSWATKTFFLSGKTA